MGLREAIRRADTAVQDTKHSVTATVVVAAAALLVAAVALIVVVVKT